MIILIIIAILLLLGLGEALFGGQPSADEAIERLEDILIVRKAIEKEKNKKGKRNA